MTGLDANRVRELCVDGWRNRGLDQDFPVASTHGWWPVVAAEDCPQGWAWMVSQWQPGAAGAVRVCDWGVADVRDFRAMCDWVCDPFGPRPGCAVPAGEAGGADLPGVRIEEREAWCAGADAGAGDPVLRLGIWEPLSLVMSRVGEGRVRLPEDAGSEVLAALAALAVEELPPTEEGFARRRIVPGCATVFTRNLARSLALWRDYARGLPA
ncbi:MAG: hypothetical protein CMF76_09325 [Maricaulis sp.]|nr:hypothetical protein [Oceanicaulis sp.]MAZ92148.1 hypothetical protein [Maricaulis sp.]